MNLSSVFTEALKKGNWPIYYIEESRKFSVGDYFAISGSKYRPISKIVLNNAKGKAKLELVPIKGTLKMEVEEDNTLTLNFKYECKKKINVFFMRFHFFKYDPAVFTFQDNPFDEGNDCEKCCCECCCPSIQVVALAYQSGGDGDQGGGGFRAR